MSNPRLVRRLGSLSATAIVVSNMIGTGIFTTSGFLAGDLGSPALVIGIWFVGALVALIGALCYAELGVNFPHGQAASTCICQKPGVQPGALSTDG